MTQQKGVTLIEVMLVLAIASLFIVMGIRQYQSYQSDMNIQQFNSDMDKIFQAMKEFHSANCGPPTPPNSSLLYQAAMNNLSLSPPYPPFPISIKDTLIAKGYLGQAPLPSPNDPIANSYNVQFNEYTQPKMICINAADCTNPVNLQQVGTIITWKIQVAVLMADTDPTQIANYKTLLNADCISSIDGDIVTPCSAPPTAGDYLVFERLPSFAVPNAQSGLELMLSGAKQVQQLYYTNSSLPNQFFTCGM